MAFADININTGLAPTVRLPCRGGGQVYVANFSCEMTATASHGLTDLKTALGLPANAIVLGIVFSGGTALQVAGPIGAVPTIDIGNQTMVLRQSNNGDLGGTAVAVGGGNTVSFTVLVVF